MTIDYSRYKIAFACDVCVRNVKLTPKQPADSGGRSWLCNCCGHMNIGSLMVCRIGDWLRVEPIKHIEG